MSQRSAGSCTRDNAFPGQDLKKSEKIKARVELELLHFNDIKIGMPLFFVVGCNTVMFLFVSCSAQKTITCGAAIKTAAESSTVKKVKAIRQTLSSTMAANFHSFSIIPASPSALILFVITLISSRME